ncbi:Amiloride-sensitive sodium channel,putative [Schistosoma mansoni]|uniref:Amiloride-sensitive sodium channel,putative n=1 Tax=Schistosoma mansoni TaxID=6183 RepID=UPI00019B34AC|nr:Amiloride-sensitive sodium channel,putative [Schistosoma mansoni]|eukprot:XP_018646185.1 Amiloride-sensitive sodium channel,putative [Schistosoma mansoni]
MKCFSSVFSQSSLVPLAKIANAPSRSLRILWAIVTAIMFIGLCVCISLVVMQYLKHQTVFQLDYSGRHTVYDQVPGITICPQSQESKRLFLDAMKRLNIITQPIPLPWFSKTVMDQLRMKVIEIQPDLKFGIIVHRLPKGELLWNTSKTAISPIYRMLLNFSVEFQIQPSYLADSYRLTVMEQVPNIRNFLCTTFELRSNNVEKSWSYLEIRINQESTIENSNRVTFIIITHERGELPFSAYDRHIHTNLPPDTSVSLYFSKSVTTRLNTDYLDTIRMKNKQQTFVSDTTNYLQFALKRLKQKTKEQYLSQTNTVSLFGTEFLYSREACGWVECCTKVAYHCNCTCTLDLLSINRTALQTHFLCERTQCQDEQIPYETCPLPCIQTKFIKHSEVRLPGYEDGLPILTSRLKLVRSESVQVAMEEEIFSLAKLFSEVGGLCSLFIGFSCIFLFELLEALILMYYPNIHKMNDQKCLTTPFIQANRHITDIIPNVNIDSMMNSTITTITTTNICNDISSENNNHKFSYSDNRIKANVSSANDASMEEYIDNEHTLSLSNQYEHNLNDINGSNHLYILPIWLSTNIPLHIIQNRQNDNIRKSFQIKSNNSKQLTNSLDHNNKLQEEGDEEGEECVYGETTTICSREELIKLLQQNRIRIKVMFTDQ